MGILSYIGKNILKHTLEVKKGNISGSATSTGSFGRVDTTGDIYASGRVYEAGTSIVDHATAMAIVFGG